MYGSEEARKRIFDDVAKIYKTNLEGDFKICNFHNVELRLPFAAYRLAEFTVGLPVELKIGPAQDTLRKLVLRRAAQNFGLPEFVVTKPKKAIQYATGISKVLRKLAKKKGATVGEYVRKTFQKTFDEMK
jgi:asparagine synthase (glutamine-hydrolysing)